MQQTGYLCEFFTDLTLYKSEIYLCGPLKVLTSAGSAIYTHTYQNVLNSMPLFCQHFIVIILQLLLIVCFCYFFFSFACFSSLCSVDKLLYLFFLSTLIV